MYVAFFWLMDKEAVLASGLVEQSQAGKTKLNTVRKKMEFGRCYVAARGEQYDLPTGTLSQAAQ